MTGVFLIRKTVLADSPAPFPSLQVQTTIVFPADAENHRSPFTYNDLLPYLRQRNCGSDRGGLGIKLKIWTKSKASQHTPQVSEPLTIRAKIQDVVTVFLNVTFRSIDRDPIVIESVVALGPREKVRIPVRSFYRLANYNDRKAHILIPILRYTRSLRSAF